MIMVGDKHECRQLTGYLKWNRILQWITGLVKYNEEVYDMVMELFDWLPVACLVDGKLLCGHGWISHELQNVNPLIQLKISEK